MMTEQTEQDFCALWEAVATGRLEVVAEALSSGHALTGSGTNSCSGDSASSSSFAWAVTFNAVGRALAALRYRGACFETYARRSAAEALRW